MEESRRRFLKQGVLGTLALGTASLPLSIMANNTLQKQRKRKKAKAKRVVLLSLDGISVDGFRKANIPNIDRLFAQGTLSLETRVVMPSITLPNWTSHLTGSGPELHGVTDNEWNIDHFKLPALETDEDGYYPSVFKVLKDNVQGMKTAFYYNWANLIYPYNKKYLDEINLLPGDSYAANFDKAFAFIKENRNTPTLSFIYTVHTDEAGHAHKWMSPEYIKSIEETDVEIGKFVDKMKAEGLFEDTHFFFLTDHGGINYGHGDVSVDEMLVPWGITGPGIKAEAAMQEPNNTVNTASIILYLFGVEQPLCWTGEVPESLFE